MEANAIGNYMKELRKQHGYTQEFVASQLNVIRQTYSHYETGRISTPLEMLASLAKFYHVPPESFMTRYAQSLEDADDLLFEDYLNEPIVNSLESASSYTINPQNADETFLLNSYRLFDDRDKKDMIGLTRVKMSRYKK